MKNEELLSALKQVAKVVADTFGPTCEVVVHDLSTREIVAIENGDITGRKIGDKLAEQVRDYWSAPAGQTGQNAGYLSRSSKKGHLLKSTSLVLTDKEELPVAMFSLNIDIEQLKIARDILDSLLTPTALLDTNNHEDKSDTHVLDYTRKIMANIMQQVGKPLPLTSKEGKLLILKELDAQGVFLVRDVVPAVCDVLSISQATLYNYLREIRGDQQES